MEEGVGITLFSSDILKFPKRLDNLRLVVVFFNFRVPGGFSGIHPGRFSETVVAILGDYIL